MLENIEMSLISQKTVHKGFTFFRKIFEIFDSQKGVKNVQN